MSTKHPAEIVLPVVGAVATVVVSTILAIALQNVIVRYRAQFVPRPVQLPTEEGEEAPAPPTPVGFFSLFARIKKIEGWAGFLKGTMPSLLSGVLVSLFMGFNGPLDFFSLSNLVIVLLSPLIVPLVVLLNRSITIPQMLPWFSARSNLRALFTPNERKRPWMVAFTPGLLVALVLNLELNLFLRAEIPLAFRQPLHHWNDPHPVPEPRPIYSDPVKIVVFVVSVIVYTLIATPLEVIAVKLSVQRRNGVEEPEPAPPGDAITHSSPPEDVITLRSDDEPYTGLVDCWKTVQREEGWGALYRLWWLVLLGAASIAFVATRSPQPHIPPPPLHL